MKIKLFKRVKMPLTFRMQNFLLLDNEIFWTSATKTIKQKLISLIKRDKSHYSNTSRGYTLPFHGQMILHREGVIARLKDSVYENYNLSDGRYLMTEKHSLTAIRNIRALSEQYLQGVALFADEYFASYHSTPGKNPLVVHLFGKKENHYIDYKDYKKWYWKEWEGEGIQFVDGNLYLGINVKTIFGFHLNYIYVVDEL